MYPISVAPNFHHIEMKIRNIVEVFNLFYNQFPDSSTKAFVGVFNLISTVFKVSNFDYIEFRVNPFSDHITHNF